MPWKHLALIAYKGVSYYHMCYTHWSVIAIKHPKVLPQTPRYCQAKRLISKPKPLDVSRYELPESHRISHRWQTLQSPTIQWKIITWLFFFSLVFWLRHKRFTGHKGGMVGTEFNLDRRLLHQLSSGRRSGSLRVGYTLNLYVCVCVYFILVCISIF